MRKSISSEKHQASKKKRKEDHFVEALAQCLIPYLASRESKEVDAMLTMSSTPDHQTTIFQFTIQIVKEAKQNRSLLKLTEKLEKKLELVRQM